MRLRSLLLLILAAVISAGAQIPFVKGIAIDQPLTEMTFDSDSVDMAFTDFRQKAAKADLQVAFGQVRITEAKGWLESAYVQFAPYPGAQGYHVYVKGGRYADFTRIDAELVRNYGSYGRADVVGLTPADDYQLRVVPTDASGHEINAASVTQPLQVKPYDRCGFAHFNHTGGVGAYRDDGTLKADAQVIYVTASTARTVSATLSSGTFTGLQAMLTAYEKGNVTTPLAVRIVGCIDAADMDALGSSAEGIQIKGRSNATPLNITVEGIGCDATVKNMGFLVRKFVLMTEDSEVSACNR